MPLRGSIKKNTVIIYIYIYIERYIPYLQEGILLLLFII